MGIINNLLIEPLIIGSICFALLIIALFWMFKIQAKEIRSMFKKVGVGVAAVVLFWKNEKD